MSQWDQLQAQTEAFVVQALATVEDSAITRRIVAASLLEIAGTLARLDVSENPREASFYAQALLILTEQVLGPVQVPQEMSH